MNVIVDRVVISDGNVIVSETNATLHSLRLAHITSLHVKGIKARMYSLGDVNKSFRNVVSVYQSALRDYLSDVEHVFGRDIRLRSSTASERDISVAIGKAYEHAGSAWYKLIDMEEEGDAYTNGIAIELLPKYPDVMFLVDSRDALLDHISFYSHYVYYYSSTSRCCGIYWWDGFLP